MTAPGTRRVTSRTKAADGSMSLLEHMQELRRRLFYSLIAITITLVVAYVFFVPILHFIDRPYCDLPRSRRVGGDKCNLVAFGVLDPFKIRLQLSLYIGIALASPIWLYQLWAFITPGLHRNERRWALSFVALSVGLFAAGGALAYLTLSKGLNFLLGAAGNDVTNLVPVDRYLSYVTAMVLVFGISFEFPLLLLMLNLTGILSGDRMLRWWRAMVFGLTVFAAVATPSQDPFTMTALALPMIVLYFLTCFVARGLDKRKARRRAEREQDVDAGPPDNERIEPSLEPLRD
jgi:sec-independent protein translocase protein TatC